MSTHNPAPWYVLAEGITDAAIGYRAILDNDGYAVCNPSPMGEVNARLIASAPDLLAALQMVASIWSHDQTANIDPDSPLAKVRAAIAKATSEAA